MINATSTTFSMARTTASTRAAVVLDIPASFKTERVPG